MKLIEQGKLEDHVATAWLGMLLGDERFLKGRKPNYQFFKEFLDRTDGKIPEPQPVSEIDLATAAAQLPEFADDARPDNGSTEEVPEQSEPVQ
jgi:hypothetical protein